MKSLGLVNKYFPWESNLIIDTNAKLSGSTPLRRSRKGMRDMKKREIVGDEGLRIDDLDIDENTTVRGAYKRVSRAVRKEWDQVMALVRPLSDDLETSQQKEFEKEIELHMYVISYVPMFFLLNKIAHNKVRINTCF